jgi:hypothetical protein
MRDTTGAGGPLSSYVILGDLTGTSILGTAGAANANVLTVQGIASGTPVPVSGTVSVGTPAVTQSGTWTVNNKGNSGNTVDFPSTQNVATPQAAWLVGGEFNTTPTAITSGNSSPLQLDTNGNLLVNVKTGATSGTVGQGSTTSGQSGMLVQGAVTTAAPTYTTAQTNPLSLDTAGNLRVASTGATPAGTNNIGFVTLGAGTSGGCTPGQLIAAGASTNGTNIKASAGVLCSLTIIQQGTNAGQFRLQDAASANCASATGVVANIPIQSNAISPGITTAVGPYGLTFNTGISFCFTGFATANIALNTDSTNWGGTTGNVVINYSFK